MPKKNDNVSDISKFKKGVDAATDAGEDTPQDTGGPGDIDSAEVSQNTRDFPATAEAIQLWEKEQAKIDKKNAAYLKLIAPHKDEQAKILKHAKEEFGVNPKIIKRKIKQRKDIRREDDQYEAFSPELQSECDQMDSQFDLFDADEKAA